jgi:hypothetical protein
MNPQQFSDAKLFNDSSSAHSATGGLVSRRNAMNVLVKSSAALAVTSAAMSAEIFSSDDHVFAAIERHRQAHKAFVEAATAADEASTGTTALKQPPKVCIGFHKKGSFSRTAAGSDGSYTITWTPNGETEPLYVDSLEGIKRNVPENLCDPDRAKWLSEKEAELEEQLQEAAESKPALAEQALSEAGDLEVAAMWDLVGTVPTTTDGIVALLSYVRSNDGDGAFLDAEHREVLAWTIERAVRAMAGLPEPAIGRRLARLVDGDETAIA